MAGLRATVLMPTHNRAHLIGHAIASVLNQTEQDFELLVVADGCTDRTCDLVRQHADPRIRLFDLPKAPYFGYANRNIALRQSQGEFVVFAAHDNLLFPDHIERLIRVLEHSGREWAYSQPLWVSTDGVIVPIGTNLTNHDELERFLTVGNSIPATCIVFRRSCLERYGYMPEDVPVAADWHHWIAMLGKEGGRNLAYLSTPTCLHFSADWRKSRYGQFRETGTWLELVDGCTWWPSALRYDVRTGQTEQAVVAAAMQAGGAQWVASVREAASMATTRVAWDDIRFVRPERAAGQARIAALETQLVALTTQYEIAVGHAGRLNEEAIRLARENQGLAAAIGPAEAAHRAALDALLVLKRDHDVALEHGRRLHDETLRQIREHEQLAAAAQRAEAAGRAALAEARALLGQAIAREELSRVELDATKRSVSWRLTRPMRRLKRGWGS